MAVRGLDRVGVLRRKVLRASEMKALPAGWKLARLDTILGSSDLDLRFRKGPRELRVTLSPDPRAPAWQRTRCFGVSYAEASLDAELRAVLRALLFVLARNEGGLSQDDLALLRGAYAVIDGVLHARLTLRCHERCLFCFASEEAPENTPDLIHDLDRLLVDLPRFPRQGVRRLLITGGEPTLVPGLPGLIRAARAAGFEDIELQTTARRFADPAYRALMTQAPAALPDRAFVSFYAVEPEAFQAIARVPKGLEERFAGLGALLDLGVPVQLNFLMLRANLAELPRFVDEVHRRYSDRVRELTFSAVAPFSLAWTHREQIPRFSELSAPLAGALDRAVELGYDALIPSGCSIPRCVLPKHEAHFLSGSDDPTSARMGKSKPASCRRCRHDSACPGVWDRYRELYGDDEMTPVMSP